MRYLLAALLPARARMRRAVAALGAMTVAAVLAVIAGAFLLAALYMALAVHLGAPLAALATGILLLAAAVLIFELGRRAGTRPAPDGLPADVSRAAAEAARQRPFEALLVMLVAGALYEQLERRPPR